MGEPAPRARRGDAIEELRRSVDDAMAGGEDFKELRYEVALQTDGLLELARGGARRRASPRSWANDAIRHEILAESAESNGRRVTAAQHYYKAVLCLGRARQLIHVAGHPRRRLLFVSILRCHGQMMRLLGGALTKHVLDIPEGRVFCLFHRAPADGPRPTVLYIPDPCATKEEVLDPFGNPFAQRGMHVCVIDPPGYAECRYHQVWERLGSSARAGRRVVDHLVSLDEVHPGMIGVLGTGLGTRYAIEIAADDPRIRAVAARMSRLSPGDLILAEASPSLRRLYMAMTNVQDEAEFYRLARRMDERFVAAKRRLWRPHLMVASDTMEPACRIDLGAWMDQLFCPKELWYHHDGADPSEASGDSVLAAIADWLNEVLGSHRPVGRDVRQEFVL